MASYNVAVIGGDGTGPEVAAEAVKVLKAAAAKFGFKLNLTDFENTVKLASAVLRSIATRGLPSQ